MSLLQSIASTAASKAGAALVGTAFAVASVGAASATGLLPELASTDTPVVEEPTEEPTLQEEPDTGEEPIVEEEESIVDEPIVEDESGTEEEPDSGEEPVLEEQEPIVDEPIVEEEPGTEEEPLVEEDESVVKAPNPVSQVVGVHQGDPGFGQAVSDAARKGGLGQQVSQVAKNKHRGGETVTDGEDAEVEAAESTSSKADKPGKGKGRSGR